MAPSNIKIIVNVLLVALIVVIFWVLAKRYQVHKTKIKELRKEKEILDKKYKEFGKLLQPQKEDPILNDYDDDTNNSI